MCGLRCRCALGVTRDTDYSCEFIGIKLRLDDAFLHRVIIGHFSNPQVEL